MIQLLVAKRIFGSNCILIARCIMLFTMLSRNIFRSLKYGNKSVDISRLTVISPLSTITVTSGTGNAQFRRNRMLIKNQSTREYTDRRDLTNLSVLQVIKDTAYIFFQSTNIIKISNGLSTSCENQAYDQKWFTGGLLEENFRSKLLLMVTHVWIYHRKLYVEQGKDVRALRIQDLFFEQLWEDYMHRLAAEKVGSFMLSKYLIEVQQLSFQVCMLYDEALAKADENDRDDTEVVNSLGGIIWNNIYERRDDIPEEHILEFARYILREHKRVFYLPYEEFLEGKAPWGPIPDFKNISRSGVKAGQGPDREWKSPQALAADQAAADKRAEEKKEQGEKAKTAASDSDEKLGTKVN